MGRGLTHIISKKDLKSFPYFIDGCPYEGKLFFCSKIYFVKGWPTDRLFS